MKLPMRVEEMLAEMSIIDKSVEGENNTILCDIIEV